EWVHVQLHQQKGMISLSPPTICNSALEGASQEDLNLYRAEVERDQAYGNWRDFFLNKKGSVTSVSGDANLDQIADVSYLLDTFFAKVTRTALQNAASIAGLMITTEAMVAEAPKKDEPAMPPGGGMGGMGGMDF
ncbi:hypothetical protein U4Y92_25210, partial [Escherichia coli]|nr:hypothetical protein [Escherichia coli]